MRTALPAELALEPISRHPLRLSDASVEAILRTPLATRQPCTCRPTASLIMVTYNHLVFTRACLATLLANTPVELDWELIIVDNASTDATAVLLQAVASHVVRNSSNRGFAPAVNQGLALARGDVLVVLNNDVLVPAGWLPRLMRHLEDPAVGLVGPVTNAAPNEAQIDTSYTTYGEFEHFARDRAQTFSKCASDISMLTMFCLAVRRDTFKRIGPLDERFRVGTFEDDDYSRRALEADYRVICAEDVFVHHFGQASFGDMVPGGGYADLIAENRARFEQKWGITWQPHHHRPGAEYVSLVENIRSLASALLPVDATVLVTSRGDDALLELGARRRGWHFPQSPDGTYAGFYPKDSTAAIAHLEDLRAAGADHLLFPSTSQWWLYHYTGLREHLDRHYRRIVNDHATCSIYQLRGQAAA